MLRGWIEAGEALGISAIAWAEFLCGPLDENDKALASVRRGLKEAKAGIFSGKGPDLGAAQKLAGRLRGD